MSAKNARQKRRCAKKVTYGSEAAARSQAANLHRKDGHRIWAYRCPFCGGWHVGHPPRKVLQSARAKRAALDPGTHP